ncbi:BREX-2 system adenine-specific DNA-methyltransferase PglX [Spirillospora sp. NPDC052242]
MIDRKALLTDLKKQVVALEGELRERAGEDEATHARLHGEWQKAREANRIAATYESWLDDRVTQAAVAWVLGTVFLRFCEDNGLIEHPFLAGPGEKLALAQERQADHIARNPHDTDRHWILAGFAEMSRSPVAAGLFDKAHNPMWQIEIPHHAAKELLAFWRRRDGHGEIVHDFTDPEWDTRFLGDLYQDLSEHAKKTYALLQTPEFVEEFILDYTLEPAIDEFGLDGLRLIDPTCGSGHFLLGAFNRILNKWRDAEPATEIWTLIRRTLLSVHGVDKNPFATNIARFRMLVAVMRAGRVSLLASVPDFPIIVATGDSLLHGRGAPGMQEDLLSEIEPHTYVTEDINGFIGKKSKTRLDAVDLLGIGSYHVVVGNPPYITVKDKKENENYRVAYKSCAGKYALTVPFIERFFQLALRGENESLSGHVGQITANSFMKREFGKRIIEEFLPTVRISYIIDTSGVHIPGHATPTVIMFGRRFWSTSKSFARVVVGVRSEPGRPDNAANGLVWRSILNNIDSPGIETQWVAVRDMELDSLAKYPWSISGGETSSVMDKLEDVSKVTRLKSYLSDSIGFAAFSGVDEVFYFPRSWHRRYDTPAQYIRPLITGEDIKLWAVDPSELALAPYGEDAAIADIDVSKGWANQLWLAKQYLGALADFSGKPRRETAVQWWSWYRWVASRNQGGARILFAKIATHNHAVFTHGRAVSNQHVPVINIKSDLDADLYYGILAVLNSSPACFWLKQVCPDRGKGGYGGGVASEDWERFYEVTGAKLQDLPLPASMPIEVGRVMDSLAASRLAASPSAICVNGSPSREKLDAARSQYESAVGQMIAWQEESDWQLYESYGLTPEGLTVSAEYIPQIKLGERAFEIVLARKVKLGEIETEWFNRHGSIPVTQIPEHWPSEYRRVIAKRIEIIENRRDIALIERPECKRRWSMEPWESQEKAALRSWLLDRCEDRSLWFADDEYGVEQPSAVTVNQLADRLRQDEDFVSVVRLYAGDDADLAKVIAEITQDEHVPHLAALRYKDSGLRKRGQWEVVWEQQREEDRTGKRIDISVPPKYASADFLKTSYWRNRGKLDVPKERFISYPGSSPDGDLSMLLGWAGWDHREQAQALMMLIEERATQDGWDAARLTPLLAGLAEVLPWVRQWHGEVDPAFGQSPADAYSTYLETKQAELGISGDDLKKWRPEKPKRGGRKKKDA